jgi:hypothetical protein
MALHNQTPQPMPFQPTAASLRMSTSKVCLHVNERRRVDSYGAGRRSAAPSDSHAAVLPRTLFFHAG